VDSASNRNEYQKYFLGSKGGRCLRLKPYNFYVPILLKSVILTLLEPSGSAQACYRDIFTFIKQTVNRPYSWIFLPRLNLRWKRNYCQVIL